MRGKKNPPDSCLKNILSGQEKRLLKMGKQMLLRAISVGEGTMTTGSYSGGEMRLNSKLSLGSWDSWRRSRWGPRMENH